MRKRLPLWSLALLVCMLSGYGVTVYSSGMSGAEPEAAEPEKGPHRGRLLKEEGFAVELAIFETGVPPEFRVWVTDNDKPVSPEDVSLNIVLTRLGGVEDHIKFTPQGDFLRGDQVVYEPHSFVVSAQAQYQGKTYQWTYENFEGRTRIEQEIAKAMGIETGVAGPAVLTETVKAYGRLAAHPESVRAMSARFEGTVKQVEASQGQQVRKGQPLLTIESNESLKPYTLTAPTGGVIRERNANPGEQTNGRVLLTLADHTTLVAELSVFPANRHRIEPGAKVSLTLEGLQEPVEGVIDYIGSTLQANQAVIVRADIDNKNRQLVPGLFVSGAIEVAEYEVPLAVQRDALQSFRDFTVVYAKVGDEYEVRMLELGRGAGDWVEVLGGLKPGTEYVTGNSYILKADIEKSGASHDH